MPLANPRLLGVINETVVSGYGIFLADNCSRHLCLLVVVNPIQLSKWFLPRGLWRRVWLDTYPKCLPLTKLTSFEVRAFCETWVESGLTDMCWLRDPYEYDDRCCTPCGPQPCHDLFSKSWECQNIQLQIHHWKFVFYIFYYAPVENQDPAVWKALKTSLTRCQNKRMQEPFTLITYKAIKPWEMLCNTVWILTMTRHR